MSVCALCKLFFSMQKVECYWVLNLLKRDRVFDIEISESGECGFLKLQMRGKKATNDMGYT